MKKRRIRKLTKKELAEIYRLCDKNLLEANIHIFEKQFSQLLSEKNKTQEKVRDNLN